MSEFCLELNLDAEAETELYRQFEMVTVQRKLKDAGRFVFIEHKKGDSSYLRFVEPTVTKVRLALARLRGTPELDEFAALLDRTFGPLAG